MKPRYRIYRRQGGVFYLFDRHTGTREGCKIALTPLVTDLPIIVVALVLAAKLAELRTLFGIVSFAGGAFVLYLAWENVHPVRLDTQTLGERPKSWLKGILTNLLNPHPWLFWLTIGAATLAKAPGPAKPSMYTNRRPWCLRPGIWNHRTKYCRTITITGGSSKA